MTILVTTGLYPPEIGGPATYTKLLEGELPKQGIAVTVLPFSRVRAYPKIVRHLLYTVLVWWQARGCAAVFAQDTVSVGLPSYLATRLTRTKLIVRVPGDYAWEQAVQRYGVTDDIDTFQTKRYGSAVERLRRVQERVVCGAAQVITPSNYFNQLVTDWGVSPERVRTIYNGVALREVSTVVRMSHTIISAGRLVSWKGFTTLIDILPELPDWQLVILGDGPERAALEARAQERGVQKRVIFAGRVSTDEMTDWLAKGTVFALNTQFESFSFQIVEAMHAGIPVVTTTVGSLPELITSGQEGVLLQPNDHRGFREAIQSVVADAETWNRRTAAAQQKAKQFSIKSTVTQVREILATL